MPGRGRNCSNMAAVTAVGWWQTVETRCCTLPRPLYCLKPPRAPSPPGTKFRQMLRAGDDIPEWFAFKSVVKVLREQVQKEAD